MMLDGTFLYAPLFLLEMIDMSKSIYGKNSPKGEYVGARVSDQEVRRLQQIRQQLTERMGIPVNQAETIRYVIQNFELGDRA